MAARKSSRVNRKYKTRCETRESVEGVKDGLNRFPHLVGF